MMNNYTDKVNTNSAYKKYICLVCGWIYDEQEGVPEEGIAPGTRWQDIPDEWVCPECGAIKDDFEMVVLEGEDE